jgi:hypothetical protein
MPAMRQVTSETVREIGHDPETNELHVTWKKSGKTSVYSGVDAEKAKTVMNSWSINGALNDLVKPHHGHAYK